MKNDDPLRMDAALEGGKEAFKHFSANKEIMLGEALSTSAAAATSGGWLLLAVLRIKVAVHPQGALSKALQASCAIRTASKAKQTGAFTSSEHPASGANCQRHLGEIGGHRRARCRPGNPLPYRRCSSTTATARERERHDWQ
uniref:Uncharacterized protein n=1 Tax=Trichuris muris TaxID=70415 RepID=A0A5S6R5Z6_TRIMR